MLIFILQNKKINWNNIEVLRNVQEFSDFLSTIILPDASLIRIRPDEYRVSVRFVSLNIVLVVPSGNSRRRYSFVRIS